MPPILSAEALCKSFGDVHAVEDVSFQVSAGEVVGLLGPNGAGKTTVLRMLAGILTPDSGRVVVDGMEMAAEPIEAKRRLGFLSGDTQLYQRLNTREMLEYFGSIYQVPRVDLLQRIDRLIAELEMSSFAARPCGTLSSGQKQRANIARAFLHDPVALILDEPTTALDVVSGQFIVEAIRRKRADGRAVLFSTHIMGEAEYLCDRIVLIHRGGKVDEGSLDDIVSRSGRRNLTDAFLAAIGQPA
jgi:sodium transport system ATP-binding protein